jgi:hypothetical protein
MIKLSENIKLLPNIDFYLIHKYHKIKNDSMFIKTYDLIIDVLNHKNLDEIEKIVNLNELIKHLNDKNKINDIYNLFIDYRNKDDIRDIKEFFVIKPKENKTLKYKKKRISATLKRLVWNHWIGEEIGKTKCLCCKTTYITAFSFHCGHIIPEKNGGDIILSNLKPICQNCNSSMGCMNMDEFMKSFR